MNAASIVTTLAPTTSLPAAGTPFCCSWSGGKDSCLALYRAQLAGARPAILLTMLTEGGERTRSHGLRRDVIAAQATALGVELRTVATTWDDYESSLVGLLRHARERDITAAVFGDIDIDRHRDWEERVCHAADIEPFLPLWQANRRMLLDEWWQAGFQATIVAVRDGIVDRRYLGRLLDRVIADEFERQGIDACGENGEFHTLVTAGPLFKSPLKIELGEQVLRGGCWFQDLTVQADV